MSESRDPFLQKQYDTLWQAGKQRIVSGTIDLDPILSLKGKIDGVA